MFHPYFLGLSVIFIEKGTQNLWCILHSPFELILVKVLCHHCMWLGVDYISYCPSLLFYTARPHLTFPDTVQKRLKKDEGGYFSIIFFLKNFLNLCFLCISHILLSVYIYTYICTFYSASYYAFIILLNWFKGRIRDML